MIALLAIIGFSGTPLPFPEQPDIFLECHVYPGAAGAVFFAPHENEHVGNPHLIARLRERGGRFYILRQAGSRHIALRIMERRIEIDPNRIFTPAGARQTVARLNPDLDEHLAREAGNMAHRLGRFILTQLIPGDTRAAVVAIHNNTDGYDGDGKGGRGTVSIDRYADRLAAGAGYLIEAHRGKGDEDDLFFINHPDDSEAMKRAGWHHVLQNPAVAVDPDEDDGSLSVYAEKIGVRYINIEAQRADDDGTGRNHRKVQVEMIDFVLDLSDSGNGTVDRRPNQASSTQSLLGWG